jgi:hypothetical protein
MTKRGRHFLPGQRRPQILAVGRIGRIGARSADREQRRHPVHGDHRLIGHRARNRDAIDWMYTDPEALGVYETFSKVRRTLMAKVRDQYFPKAALWPDKIRGLDIVLSDALKNKFIARPLTAAEIKEMIQIPAPM